LQSAVCATEVGDVQGLQKQTLNGFETIRTTPGNFQRVRQWLFTHVISALMFKVETWGIFFTTKEVVKLETILQ